MSLFRLIARLDVKGENVVKGLQFEGLRVVGRPQEMAERYAAAGADELLYIDTVASLYGRNQLAGTLEAACERVFVPITVGGGIASIAEARRLFNAGADKVAINTAALARPALVSDLAAHFGSQAVVVQIDAKRVAGGWEAYTDNGRNRTGRDAVAWALEAVERGAGEILLTSIDRDGTRRGMDVELVAAVAPRVPVPVVAGGGLGAVGHLEDALFSGKADAVAVGAALHYDKVTIPDLQQAGRNARGTLRMAQAAR